MTPRKLASWATTVSVVVVAYEVLFWAGRSELWWVITALGVVGILLAGAVDGHVTRTEASLRELRSALSASDEKQADEQDEARDLVPELERRAEALDRRVAGIEESQRTLRSTAFAAQEKQADDEDVARDALAERLSRDLWDELYVEGVVSESWDARAARQKVDRSAAAGVLQRALVANEGRAAAMNAMRARGFTKWPGERAAPHIASAEFASMAAEEGLSADEVTQMRAEWVAPQDPPGEPARASAGQAEAGHRPGVGVDSPEFKRQARVDGLTEAEIAQIRREHHEVLEELEKLLEEAPKRFAFLPQGESISHARDAACAHCGHRWAEHSLSGTEWRCGKCEECSDFEDA